MRWLAAFVLFLCGVQCGHRQILRNVQAHLPFRVYCKEAPPAGTLPEPEVLGRSTERAAGKEGV